MKIGHLKTNHLDCPLGYQLDYLFLSWEVTGTKAETDEWTQIEIALDNTFKNVVYTSSRMKNLGKPYYSPAFVPIEETRYYWRVTICTIQDGIICSNPVWFETGVAQKDWKAEWIGAPDDASVMPEIYRIFQVGRQVKQARLYSYGVGVYEAYINGEKAGDEFLTPGYHSYDFINQYQTFDITDMLIEGENRISFYLGEGWYKGRFVFEGGYTNLYGSQKKIIAMIKIEYMDGNRVTISTDKEWKAKESIILENNIYDGEVVDTRREKKELPIIVLHDSKEKLCARYNTPLKMVEAYQVKEILHTPSGKTVLDFGEMITGWVEVRSKGEMDFSLLYGECMQEGEIYRTNLRTARAEFRFSGKCDAEWIRPHFTYYGFRYVQVNGINEISSEQFQAYRLMSDIEQTGEIATANEKLNKLVENSLRSQKCNFIDIPLDCPQRDERLGWTGDIALFANTGSFHMYTPAFLHHYMINFKLEQEALGGAVPFFVPTPKPQFHEGINPFLITSGACTWGDAATIVPWTLYNHYKDKEMLRQHYPIMCNWVLFVNSRVKENEKQYLWQNDRQLGDWLALDNGNINNPIGSTDMGLIASAYYYYSTVLCGKAAEVLELQEDKQKWNKQANCIKEAIIKEYLDANGDLTVTKTQTAYAMLLHLQLYEKGKKAVLVDGLRKELEKYGNHLSTGFVGTGMLMEALSDNGMEKEAYTLLLNEDYPSWLREINLGATTIWERWNSINDDGTISDTGMNSLNHYAYGCVAGWMYENLCGFKIKEGQNIQIKPVLDKRLQFVEGKYRTIYGECNVKWEWKENEKICISINIPFQSIVNVLLPWGEEQVLTNGTYFFEA